jgi:signal transduction histidine kinase
MINTDDAIKNRSAYINELKEIEQEIRKISHDLNTDFIADSGFVDIVKTLVENQTKAYQLNYSLEIDETIDWEELSNKDKIHLYRIVQESLQNVYKHANANHVKIGFEIKNNVLLVSINDDGSGFEVTKAKKGIGLKNINSRVLELNGEVDYTSSVDQGTNITIRVPI